MSNEVPSRITDASDPEHDAANRAEIETQLAQLKQQLQELPAESSPLDRARILLEIADAYLGLEQQEQAWSTGRMTLDTFIENEEWQLAVEVCSLLYQTDQPASISALGHGVWLAVTYPVELELSIVMLANIVDETPAHSDGAAVAAATAHYLTGIRTASDKQSENLAFLTSNLVARVAQRHSNVENQEQLDAWLERLELRDPQTFLPRLAKVIDVLVDGQWWFDRDALRERLPVN